MNLVEAKLRQAVALKNDVIDGLKDGRHGEYQQIQTHENSLKTVCKHTKTRNIRNIRIIRIT